MMTNTFSNYILVLIAFALIVDQDVCLADDEQRPNIVMILCDDLGYADVGFNGSTDIQTPSIDSLAKHGTILTSAYVAHPFCGPSRAGLMTGRYPHTIGSQFNIPERGEGIGVEAGISLEEPFFSTVLQQSGYYTGLVGKWHLGKMPPYHPNKRGFDDFYGFLGGGHMYFPEAYQAEYKRRKDAGNKNIWSYYLPLEHNGQEVSESEYLTDALSHEGVRFIREASQKDQPFFLFLSYNAPHTPLEAKEEDLANYASIEDEDRRTYAAMVHAVDRGVGEVVDALKAAGEYEDTLIIFFSDNGGRVDEGGCNFPLAGSKGDTLEGGFRVPMLFHWPNQVPAGKSYSHPVTALDFYPTFAHLANADIPDDKKLDGKNIWDDLLAGRNAREAEPIYALRHRPPNNDVGVRQDQWKLHRAGKRPWSLYNIDEDIGEQNDLSQQYPERVKSMVAQAEKWTRSHTQPQWFDSERIAKKYAETGMPNFDKTFQTISPSPLTQAKKVSRAKPSTKGESKETYVTRQKKVWARNGWKWNQVKVESNFDEIDENNDEKVTLAERKAWFAKRKSGQSK